MAGFADINAIVNALSVLGYGQALPWSKIKAANTAAGGLYTLWPEAGTPAAGVYTGAAQEAVQATSSTTGALIYTNPGGSRDMFALTATGNAMATAGSGSLHLWDRLLYYPGLSHAPAALTLTNAVALPRYTTGVGVYAFLEVTTALGAAAHTCDLTYTDTTDATGNTTGAQTMVASSAAARIPHAFTWFPLASGDKGIKSVQTATFAGAGATGTSALVLAKLLAVIPVTAIGVASIADFVRGPLLALPEIEDGACLFWTWTCGVASTTPTFSGLVQLCEN